MSRNESRLCRLIVREHFGPTVEKVANILLRKGRMPVGQIVQLTQLKPRQVRECLLVMIQHNIAVYAELQERTRIVTYYEINRSELLHRTLIPRVLQDAHDWYQYDGGLIALTLLAHGKMTIEDCTKEILANHPSPPSSSTTTVSSAPSTTTSSKAQEQRSSSIKKVFTKMVKEKCLIAVRPSDSLSETDKDMAEEKKETDKMAMPPTAAELASIRKNLDVQKAKEQNSGIIGLKRSLESTETDDYSGSKRAKLRDKDLVIVEVVETDVFFKINFERFIIRWRNTEIAKLYENRLNPTATAIMQTMLGLAEERMINVKEDFTTPVSHALLSSALPTNVNMVDTLEFDPQELGSSNIKPKPYECLEKYFQLLEEDAMRVVRKDAGRSGQYIVSLKTAVRILKLNMIRDIVTARFGAPYVRIMNMLLDKGKLEEKQISRYSMMPIKDVREKLTTLCTFGVLSLQEVPKTNERTPSRTFYLWEVLLQKSVDTIVGRLYHTMGNLRQRRFVERNKRAILLEKCERSDVKADQSLLNATERKELEALHTVLEVLEVQELRLAQMVATLREY